MSLLKDRELDTYVDVPRKSLGHFLIFLHVVGKQSKTCPRLGTYLAPMSQKCSCFAVAIVAPLLEVLVVTNASEGRQENNVDKARRDGEAKRVMAADAHLMVVELLKVNKQTYEYGKKKHEPLQPCTARGQKDPLKDRIFAVPAGRHVEVADSKRVIRVGDV